MMSPLTSDVPAVHVTPAAASSSSMVDSEPAVMSVFSSDTDPDMEFDVGFSLYRRQCRLCLLMLIWV